MPRSLPALLCLTAFLLAAMTAAPLPACAADDDISTIRAGDNDNDADDGPEHGKINTPDPSVVDPGHAEFEVSYAYAQSEHLWDNNGNVHDRGLTNQHAATMSLTVGVIDNLDINLSGGYAWTRDNENDYDENDGLMGPETGDAFSDMNFGARYRFYENKALNLELAAIGTFTAPTGSRSDINELGTTQDYWSYKQTLVGTKDWGKWTVNADVGYALPFGDRKGSARGTFNADVAGGYQVLPWLQPELEFNYNHDFIADAYDANVVAVTGGLVMPIDERLRINVGIQQGIWGENSDRSTMFFIAAKTAF